MEFGENIFYLKAKTLGKDKFDTRWDSGIWLGIREESGEHIIGTEDGVVKARTIRRKAITKDRWDQEMFNKIRGTPWQPIPGVAGDEIKIRVKMPDQRVQMDTKLPIPEAMLFYDLLKIK